MYVCAYTCKPISCRWKPKPHIRPLTKPTALKQVGALLFLVLLLGFFAFTGGIGPPPSPSAAQRQRRRQLQQREEEERLRQQYLRMMRRAQGEEGGDGDGEGEGPDAAGKEKRWVG